MTRENTNLVQRKRITYGIGIILHLKRGGKEMIPSVEERSIRPCHSECGDCIFLKDADCYLKIATYHFRMSNPGDFPCRYNIYLDELKEALDSGTMYGKIFIFLKMGEEKKVDSDIAIQEYPEYDISVAQSAVDALNKGNGMNKFYLGNKSGPLESSGNP